MEHVVNKYYANFRLQIQTCCHPTECLTSSAGTSGYNLRLLVKKCQSGWTITWTGLNLLLKNLLDKRNKKFDNFITYWLNGSFTLDEAGIMLLAWAYKIHVAVFFIHSYWMTCSSRELNDVKVFLLYHGFQKNDCT